MKSLAIVTTLGVATAARINRGVTATSAPAGYTETSGKCTGSWIENWADGHSAHYGEDHHIDSVDDCADMCDQHPECAGFYAKEGRCSHWRSGALSATPHGGHTCYMKEGGGAAAPSHHSSHHASASCDAVDGYDVSPGKCTGHWIENWHDGHFAHYGEDHSISEVADCADTCDEHDECAGFYTKEGKCSHWRSGSLEVRSNPGHCCYTKSSDSLLETEAEAEEGEEAEEDHDWNIQVGGPRPRHRHRRHRRHWRRMGGVNIHIR